jgi:hypothetical protein
MKSVHHKRTECRACGGNRLKLVLSLGQQALANAFLSAPDEFAREARYPLDVYFCEECSLVQLLDVIDPEVLFRDYIYVTGTSDTIASHNVAYAETVIGMLGLAGNDLVVEVASNDGSLLRQFQARGVRTLGIEPARNLAETARARGIETRDWFFNSETARCARECYGQARAVIANNVLAHVDDPCDFLRGASHLVADDGLLVFEVPYLGELLDKLEYDTIYHEHLCYFSVTALMRLCESAGLSLAKISWVPVHGGSLRAYVRKEGAHSREVLDVAAGERKAGLTTAARYEGFAVEVEENRRALRRLLGEMRERGHAVAGYGAPAKGNTLLNYCGIDTGLVPFTVDKNDRKVGLYTPGMHIPVRPVSALAESRPDYLLILAWNFAPEIMRQQQTYSECGGRFIVPIPRPAVQ